MESTRAMTEIILQEAQKLAENILQEAQKSAKKMLEKQRNLGVQRANESAQLLLKKAQRAAEVDKMRSIADAKIKANWVILSKKEKLITDVLNETKNRLRTLTESKEYLSILEKLIIEAGTMLREKELNVLLNEKDSTLPLKLDKLVTKISERIGFETKLRLSDEKLNVIGGAMVRTADGKVIMDNTFDDILRRKEKELRFEIAKILF